MEAAMLMTFIALRAEWPPRLRRASLAAGGTARRLLAWCAACWARAQQRRALRDLDAAQRRDIGITEGEALREANKPFWRR
jgi:uncharacterized protein YjiS (DUF1127 family)